MTGYIKLHRGWHESNLFKDNEPYCERAAWCWLLSKVAWKESHRRGPQGDLVTVKEGEFHTSLRTLAKAWNWDKNKVSRFIKRATACGNIGTSAGQGGLHLTICKWGIYQGEEDKREPQSKTSEGQARDTQEEGIRRDKKKEASKEASGTAEKAAELWNEYARQSGAPKILKLSPDRKAKLNKRLDENGITGWQTALGIAARSQILGHDPPGWFDFNFLIQNETNILKLLEGKYDKHFSSSSGNGNRSVRAGQAALERLATRKAERGSSEFNGCSGRIDQEPNPVRALRYVSR